MNVTKKHVHIALIWLLSSLFYLQVSYVVHTTTSITIGWTLTVIFLIVSLIAGKKHSATK
ncbi:hypothetical protein [Bacillus sp. R86525]|uniref:hypothetical protein n=1 Tax=Bacillus sp. R86525 TaxID=3101709 RepID=UPI0036702C6D